MKYSIRILTPIVFVAISFLISQVGFSQPSSMQIVSPEVHADRTVTFRLLAPNAKDVKVGGEFSTNPLAMIKDDNGIWSATTEPLAPDIYGYNFTMDGLTMPDPSNTSIKYGVIWFGSLVEVPGEKPAFYALQDVPHGSLHEHWYKSSDLDAARRIFVYTPPGYETSRDKTYPVLYLLHGFGDDEPAWTQVGHANFIMDNLLAEKKAQPAIIVMPFGHASRSINRAPGRPRGNNASGRSDVRVPSVFGADFLANDLLKNVIPLMEREYRVGKDRNQRAIAGLSMGGYQALSIGLNNMQHFAYIGAFSSALSNQNFETDFKSFLADPAKANQELKLLWIGCGDKDSLLSGNQKFVELLTAKDIKHEWVATPGYAHAWTLWRLLEGSFAKIVQRDLNSRTKKLFKYIGRNL